MAASLFLPIPPPAIDFRAKNRPHFVIKTTLGAGSGRASPWDVQDESLTKYSKSSSGGKCELAQISLTFLLHRPPPGRC